MNQAKPPGYDELKRIKQELPGLSPQMRTALAAACAERTLPVLERYFKDTQVFRDALDAAWAFAERGQADKGQVQKLVDDIEKRAEELYEDDEIGATLYALNAVTYALQSAVTPESTPAAKAISDAGGAADLDAGQVGESYVQEEAEWQAQALDIAKKAPAPRRDMFAALPADSRWLRALRARN
jgi:hypothetical protein